MLERDHDEEEKQTLIENNQMSMGYSSGLNFFGILIGAPESGKTSVLSQFFKYINYKMESDFSIHNFKDFRLMDTPGLVGNWSYHEFRAQQMKFYQCLNGRQINALFIVCRNNRIPNMKENIERCYRPFQNYKDLINLIINYSDSSLDQDETRQELEQSIRMDYEVKSFIYMKFKQENNLMEQIQQSFSKEEVTIDLSNTAFDIKPRQIIEHKDEFTPEQDFNQNQYLPKVSLLVQIGNCIKNNFPKYVKKYAASIICCCCCCCCCYFCYNYIEICPTIRQLLCNLLLKCFGSILRNRVKE